jgi:hypothetical protein
MAPLAEFLKTRCGAGPAYVGTVPAAWVGQWELQDNPQHTMYLSVSTLDVHFPRGGAGEPPTIYKDRFPVLPKTIAGDELGEGQCWPLAKPQRRTDIERAFQESVAQFRKDATDFSISDPQASLSAIRSLSPGSYAAFACYAGGDCGYWEMIVDRDRLLAISQCKYGHGIELYKRAGGG